MKFHVITITSYWFLHFQEKNFKVAFHNTIIIIVIIVIECLYLLATIHNFYF